MKQKLLLHCCCAPCATSVVERLLSIDAYHVTLYFSNSNILPKGEYEKRLNEVIRLASEIYPSVALVVDSYNPQEFFEAIKGKEMLGEGSERCEYCMGYRLAKTAKYAKDNAYDIFATTLTVSPHKNAKLINDIGCKLSKQFDVDYLESDFKKQNGYLRSIQLCKQYNIYRQKYCGCGLDL